MVDAVLLEFEGVIADTRAARRRALLAALVADGVTLDESEYLEQCDGMPVHAAVRAAFALRGLQRDDTALELTAMHAERLFAGFVDTGLLLVDGARSFIESMVGQTRLGIVSRASRSEIETTLSLAQIDHAFEFIIADDDAYARKPAPAPYLGAIERLKRRRAVTPSRVVALEDGATGIRAAKAAGLRCAVVGDVPVHLAVDADALVPSLVGQTAASLDAVTLGPRGAER